MNNKKKTRVILASASERRQSLLKTVIPEFSVYVTDTDETVCKTLTPTELVEELSRRKAFNAARNIAAAEGEDILIIAADTVVSIGGVILGKPADSDDARRMLDLLNGKWHEVCTGLTLTDGTHVDTQTVSQVTRVKFRDVPEDELERYIATALTGSRTARLSSKLSTAITTMSWVSRY